MHEQLIDTWLELAEVMTIRDLTGDEAPRAALASGAAGIGYTIGRIGRARGDRALVASGRRWFGIASRAAKRRNGLRAKGWPSSTHSVMFGPLGIAAARAFVEASPRVTTSYIDLTRRRMARAPAEVMFGLAGNLLAAIAIARTTGDHRVGALVGELAARLARAPTPPVGGFAHGDVGPLAARLAAAHVLGEPADLEILAALGRIEPAHVLARGGPRVRSWCNGLAGHVIAWVLGAEVGRHEPCRVHALAAGRHLLDELDEAGGSVCCGLGGRAYALLAIARLDPAGPWIEHAHDLARRALTHPIMKGGLFQGLPGLVGLAHDLLQPSSARLPFIDVAQLTSTR